MATIPDDLARARRVVVVGTSGAGKTTMSGRLAAILGLAHVELDALHWLPNWTESSRAELRQRVEAALAVEAWVVDGNYTHLRDLVWARADTVVWLDYSFPVVFGRVLTRTLRRGWRREELWSGNREDLWRSFTSRDSILWWVITTHRRRHRETPVLLAAPEYRHLRVVHLRTPGQADRLLQELEQAVGASPAAVS